MDKYCIIAVAPSSNAWGKGQTIKEAKKNLRIAGGKLSKGDLQLRFILGDDKAYVDNLGTLTADKDAKSFVL
jgi:hypothetical protein